MASRAAVILAAGMGTRMRSTLPKVLHPVGGRPVLDYSLELAKELNCDPIVCVASPRSKALTDYVATHIGPGGLALQETPEGTGHAVKCAAPNIGDHEGHLVVLYGDSPLIRAETIEALFKELDAGAAIGVLGFEAEDPGMYGRL
ncbi:MAG: NTP transferase domain-containing protein, partial [Pseudomonadota bacterium]